MKFLKLILFFIVLGSISCNCYPPKKVEFEPTCYKVNIDSSVNYIYIEKGYYDSLWIKENWFSSCVFLKDFNWKKIFKGCGKNVSAHIVDLNICFKKGENND